MSAWTTPEFARKLWHDAADLDNDLLDAFLEAAQESCEEYAPALPEGADAPKRHQIAVVYQARDIYTASKRTGDSDLIGVEDYAIRARPLTAAVRQLLRPRRAVPRFGRP